MARRPTDRDLARALPRLNALAQGLRELWRTTEKLEAALAEERDARAAVERRVDACERELALGREPHRIPAAAAARRIGVSPATVRRMIENGDLDGAALRLPGRERRVWVVEVESLDRFEPADGTPGAPGTPEPPISGRRPEAAKG